MAVLDTSTGDFKATELLGESALRCELSRIEPRELVLQTIRLNWQSSSKNVLGKLRSLDPVIRFSMEQAETYLSDFRGPKGAAAFEGCLMRALETPGLALQAAGAVTAYVMDTQRSLPEHARISEPVPGACHAGSR